METGTLKRIPLKDLTPCPLNPRKTFDTAALDELTASVKVHGVIQPLLVRSQGKGKGWEIVAGERRYKAAQAAELAEVPVVVRKLTDEDVLALAIVENEQREDVPLFEKAAGYQALLDTHGWTVEQVAAKIGKSTSAVRALLKLQRLPQKSRDALAKGELTVAVAGLIAGRPTEAMRAELEEWVFEDNYGPPPTFAEAKAHVTQTMTRELKQAPFDTKDKALKPDAGCCRKCPKRAGNMPDADPGTRADICTDPGCYAAKVLAHGLQEAEKGRKKGYTVLSEAECQRLYPHGPWLASNSPYYQMGEGCYQVPGKQGHTWEKLIGKHVAPADVAVAVDPKGKVHKLIAKDRARELLAKHYPQATNTPSHLEPWSAEDLAAETARKKELTKKVRGQVRELGGRLPMADPALCVPEPFAEVLDRLIAHLLTTGWASVRDELTRLYETAGKTARDKADLLADSAGTWPAAEKLKLLAEWLAFYCLHGFDEQAKKGVGTWFGGAKGGAK